MIQHSFPVFRDGVFLGAGDLNQLAQEQNYIWAMQQQINFAHYYTIDYSPKWLFHRYRYLHMRASGTSTSELFINGISAGQVAASATDIVIDLGNGYNGNVSNPYNLTLHRPYQIEFVGDPINVYESFEFPHATAAWSPPATNPTFVAGASAVDLNAISQNSEYFTDTLVSMPTSFTAWGVNGTSNNRFYIYHRHRYIYMKFYWNPNGETGVNHDFRVNLNDNIIFGHEAPGENSYTYHFAYDLVNNQHVEYQLPNLNEAISDFDHSGLNGWYYIQVRTTNPDANNQDAHGSIIMIGETPYTAQLFIP